MSEKFDLQYLPIAQNDLISILDWMAKDSPVRAMAFVESVSKRIGRLESLPFLGRVPRHERLKRLGYRTLIVDNYIVFYNVRDRKVEIHRILHGARFWDEILDGEVPF